MVGGVVKVFGLFEVAEIVWHMPVVLYNVSQVDHLLRLFLYWMKKLPKQPSQLEMSLSSKVVFTKTKFWPLIAQTSKVSTQSVYAYR